MVLADQQSWDRHQAAHRHTMRRWPDRRPDDELAAEVRDELTSGPAWYPATTREHVG